MNETCDVYDLNSIKKYIENNNKINEINKKQKGEIFTPFVIIDKMLKTLEDTYYENYNKSIYSNKNIKWFDNSSGVGNFMMVIFFKLNLGLKDVIKDDSIRKKHIIENMLYMSEINEDNANICINIFNPNNEYKLNINIGDSLIFDIKKTWNIDDIDIIIGNPPYQKINKKTNNSRGGKNNNLYIDFVKTSLKMLKTNGYLVYIHPQNWRKIGNNILNDFLKYKLDFIALNYGGNLFKNVSVNTDFYILQKTKNDGIVQTHVECYDKKNNIIMFDKFKINNVDFIPKYYSSEIQSIISKVINSGENRNCIINSFCHKIRNHVAHKNNKTDEHIYPLYNTSGNPYDYFSSKKHFDQDKKKVI